MRRRRYAVKATGLVILNDVPDLPAESLAVNLRVASQARLQLGDPVPRRAEERRTQVTCPMTAASARPGS